MTGRELAIEFTDLWKSLDVAQINEMLAKNVSFDLLQFFLSYAEEFADGYVPKTEAGDELRERLPNLLVIGYIIRILEERVK